ncbi:endonuclease/exonuclease/phosphatase family protein [Prosthecobacter sp.]|uniref:endonuclease/exonuclease/phosphatase family protein n=1 Tax=Prosthecobacter sp. TaxID=1965333 RepID=UPI003783A9FB
MINRIRLDRQGARQQPQEIEPVELKLPAPQIPTGLLHKVLHYLRLAVRGLIILCLVFFVLLIAGFHAWGQSNITFAALMYLPPWIWVVPLFLLLVPALILDRKSAFGLALAIVLFFAFHIDIRLFGPAAPEFNGSSTTLKVITWNRGQDNGVSLRPIKDSLQPDFITLQETRGRGYAGSPDYAEFTQVSNIGEFVLLSRWPILDASPVLLPGSNAVSAVRYQVLFEGGPLIIYNVHLPSPRSVLDSYKRGAFLWGIIGFPGSPWESKKKHYQAFWDQQILIAQNIADNVAKEKDPVLVLGDFNTPAFGPIYRVFSSQFQDAHLKAGDGTGYTFPGNTHNPLALFRPWLRLDMIFASQSLNLWGCRTMETQSQHRPVFAEFQWSGPKP